MSTTPTVLRSGGAPTWGRAHYLAPVALVVLVAAMVAVVLTSSGSHSKGSAATASNAAIPRNLPPWWTVRPGDTYALIAHQTKLTVAQLEQFNPTADPRGLAPGERLALRPHPPPPPTAPQHPPWPGPHFWTVQSGQSFGSIAAKSGINITTLLQLNPQLKPSTLQPGDVVRLRPGPDVVVDPGWVHLI